MAELTFHCIYVPHLFSVIFYIEDIELLSEEDEIKIASVHLYC